MAAKPKIAIIGAGIGGLALAGFLEKQGADVTIYEQAKKFLRVGAGIQMGPNAVHVLRAFGSGADAAGARLLSGSLDAPHLGQRRASVRFDVRRHGREAIWRALLSDASGRSARRAVRDRAGGPYRS